MPNSLTVGDQNKFSGSKHDFVAQDTQRDAGKPNVTPDSSAHSTSLAPFRVGSVPYLNAVPLTRGFEDEIVFLPPSELAQKLRDHELDAALVSVTEVLFSNDYDILDGIAVASSGEVKSVFLAHRRPLDAMQEVYCDPASLTSVNLLRVLLAEKGLHPTFKRLQSYAPDSLPDFALLIGDPALDLLFAPKNHSIWDLGAAWHHLTQLPFVYAVWALRRGVENRGLRRLLREAKQFGLETLELIIRAQSQYEYEFCKNYLCSHIHFHLGLDEKRGIAKFMELLRKHRLAQVYDPSFVD